MPDTFIPLSEVEWVEQLVCDRYKVKIPKFLADYNQWWGDWEKERFRSMEENLKRGDILFDVGAEIGWQSAIYAQFVGAENMCLFEPCPELWPSIKSTWEMNGLSIPKLCTVGFLSDAGQMTNSWWNNGWPPEGREEKLLTNTKFQHVDENPETQQMRMDDLVACTKFVECIPCAITIDVEGWELAVLKGAEKTLREHRPLVWVSLHEGFVSRPGVDPKNIDVHDFMASCGYEHRHLGVDHESHEMYIPR